MMSGEDPTKTPGKLEDLYNQVSEKYDVGSIDDFRKRFDTDERRRQFFEKLGPQFGWNDYQEFESTVLGTKPKPIPAATKEEANPSAQKSQLDSITETASVRTPELPKPISTSPTQEENKLIEDYKGLYGIDPREIGLSADEVFRELRLAHPEYEPITSNVQIRMATDEDWKKFKEESPEEFEQMLERSRKQVAFDQSLSGIRNRISKANVSDAEFVLAGPEQMNTLVNDAYARSKDSRIAAQAVMQAQDRALDRLVENSTSLTAEIKQKIAELPADQKADEQGDYREKIKNQVLNERLVYGINNLNVDQRQLYDLQLKAAQVKAKLAANLEPETAAQAAEELWGIEKEITIRREGFPQLFDPATGNLVDRDTEDQESFQRASAYEKKVQDLMVVYSKTDLGSLVRAWNRQYSKLQYISNRLADDPTIDVPGEGKKYSIREIMAIRRRTQEIAAGFGVPLSGQAAQRVERLPEIQEEAKAKFDAINRALLLNQDPSKVAKSFGSLFFEHAIEGFGINVETDVDFIENYVAAAKENGAVLTKAQEEAAKDDWLDATAKGMGDSIRPMMEILLTTYGVGAVAKIPQLIKYTQMIRAGMTARFGRTGEFAYNLASHQIQGALSFGLTTHDATTATMGLGEGTAQGILSNLKIENWFKNSKYGKFFELGTRTLAGIPAETASEFAGDFLQNVEDAGFNWELAFENTFGRNPEEFGDKLLTVAMISGMFSGAYNTATMKWTRNQIEQSDSPLKEQRLEVVNRLISELEVREQQAKDQAQPSDATQEQATVSDQAQPGEAIQEQAAVSDQAQPGEVTQEQAAVSDQAQPSDAIQEQVAASDQAQLGDAAQEQATVSDQTQPGDATQEQTAVSDQAQPSDAIQEQVAASDQAQLGDATQEQATVSDQAQPGDAPQEQAAVSGQVLQAQQNQAIRNRPEATANIDAKTTTSGEQVSQPPKTNAKSESPKSLDQMINDIAQGSESNYMKLHSHGMSSGKVKKPKGNQTEGLAKQIPFENSNVETRFKQSERSTKKSKSLLKQGREFIAKTRQSFTRHFRHLDPKKFPQEANKLRVFESLNEATVERSSQYIRGLVEPLTAEQQQIVARTIILEDLQGGIKAGLEVDGALPWDISQGEVESSLKKYRDLMESEPRAKEAYENRQRFMKQLYQDLLSHDLLTDKGNRATYFHRRMLDHMTDEIHQKTINGKKLTKSEKDFLKARTGSRGLDYSTNFIESEFKVVAESLYEIKKKQALDSLMAPYEAELNALNEKASNAFKFHLETMKEEYGKDSEQVKAFKKTRSAFVRKEIMDNAPEGYEFFQPEPGNNVFRQKSVTETQLEKILAEIKDSDNSGAAAQAMFDNLTEIAKDGLAIGGRKKEYLIPQELALTLTEMGRPEKTPNVLMNGLHHVSRLWKLNALLNPNRFLRYTINNTAGDLDAVIAADPTILKKARSSWKEVLAFHKDGQTSDLMEQAVYQGVISSGFNINEFADIETAGWAKYFAKRRMTMKELGGNKLLNKIKNAQNPVKWYYGKISKINALRENWLRYAAFKRAVEKIDAGHNFYWASDPKQVDQITDKYEKAGKLAREALVDYGNISESGQVIRKSMLPFYSWMEGNMGRYTQLMKNSVSTQDKARIAAVALKQGLTFSATRLVSAAAKISFFTAAVYAYNRLFFPDEYEELQRVNTRGMQIITGVDEDGKIHTLPFVGALYDFGDFFGFPDLIDDFALMSDPDRRMEGMEKAGETVLKAPINRVVQGLTPIIKVPTEYFFETTFFPDAFNPRSMWDKNEYLASQFAFKEEYRAASDKPSRNPYFSFDRWKAKVTRKFDVQEAAYWEVLNLVKEEEQIGGFRKPGDDEKKPMREALYNYSLAIRYDQPEEANKWLTEYYNEGGTRKALKKSMEARHPLDKLEARKRRDVKRLLRGKEPKTDFGKKLTKDELELIRTSIQYFEKTFPDRAPKLQR